MCDPRKNKTDNMAWVIESMVHFDDDKMLTLACCVTVIRWNERSHKALRRQAERQLDKMANELQEEANK